MSLLENKKLKLWSSIPNGVVSVIQDGSSADADATTGYRFDNGFRAGAGVGGATDPSDKLYVAVETLSSDYDNGKTLTISITGRDHWWYNAYGTIRLQPNDIVEFWANVGTQDAGMSTPAWHLNDATPATQVRYFYGWVDTVTVTAAGTVTATCRDAMWRANDIRTRRSLSDGLDVPMLFFNLAHDNPDIWWAVKKLTTSGGTNTYGIGAPTYSGATAVGTSSMSVKEILGYFDTVYLQALKDADIIPQAATSLWYTGTTDGLDVVPGEIALNNAGFTEAIQQVLQWVPNMRLMVDHQTRQWVLVKVGAALSGTTVTIASWLLYTTAGAPGLEFRTTTDITSTFSTTPSTSGYAWTYIPDDNREQAYRFTTAGFGLVSAGLWYVRTNEAAPENLSPGQYTPVVRPAKVALLDTAAFSTMAIDVDEDVVPDSLTIQSDLQGAYTACKIVSVHQKTEKKKELWTPGTTAGANNQIVPAWNSTLESAWNPIDSERESDYGASGSGIPIYKAEQQGTPQKWAFWIAYEDSAFKDDHATDEWLGCTMQFVTAGTLGNVRNLTWGFTIGSCGQIADIGNGKAGLKIVLTTNDITSLTASSGAIGTTAVPVSGVIDKIALTQSLRFPSTTDLNGRFQVGRVWKHVAAVSNRPPPGLGGSSAHSGLCDLVGFTPRTGTLSSQQTALRSNAFALFHDEIDRIGNGGAFGWGGRIIIPLPRKNQPSTTNTAPGCDAKGYQPPANIDIEYEETTTEVRTARYPASGHDGYAYHLHNLEREHVISSSNWTTDSKQAMYDDFAHRWWQLHCNPHYRGAVSLVGVKENAVWLDLCAKAGFTTSMAPAGTGATLTAFWPTVHGVTIDFTADTVTFNLDDSSVMQEFNLALIEEVGVKQAAWQVWAQQMMQRAEQRLQCIQSNRSAPPNPYVCNSTSAHGSLNTNVVIKKEGKNNWNGGFGDTGIGINNPTNSGSLSHSQGATHSVVRDQQGNRFGIGPGGGIFGGTTSGANFTIDPALIPEPQGTVYQAQQTAQAALAAAGLQPVTTPLPIYSSLASGSNVNGSGNTVFTLEHTGLTANAYVGGHISICDFLAHTHRTDYEIISNTSGSITVSGAVQAASLGVHVVVWSKPAPVASADFTEGSYVAKDSNGDYVVISPTGSSVRGGVLNEATNEIDTGGSAPQFGYAKPLSWWYSANIPSGVSSTDGGAIVATNPSYSAGTDYDGFVGLYNLVNNDKTRVVFEFIVPDDLDLNYIVTAKAYFRLSAAAGAGNNIRVGWEARAVANGEATLSGGTLTSGFVTHSVSSLASGVMVVVNLGTVFAVGDLGYDDLVKGVVVRDATAAGLDTFEQTLQFIGIKFTGTERRT